MKIGGGWVALLVTMIERSLPGEGQATFTPTIHRGSPTNCPCSYTIFENPTGHFFVDKKPVYNDLSLGFHFALHINKIILHNLTYTEFSRNVLLCTLRDNNF